MEALTQALKRDRLVKIFVGQNANTEPFLVQQTALEKLSVYFAKALQPDKFSEGESALLRLSDDDVHVWKALLYWMFESTLPNIEMMVLSFQNEIMLELLHKLNTGVPSLDVVKTSFNRTPPGSKLRLLMAEEVAFMLSEQNNKKMVPEDLDAFDGVVGFTSALTVALKYYGEAPIRVLRRLPHPGYGACDRWKLFMVGDGPKHTGSMIPWERVHRTRCGMWIPRKAQVRI
ncbi:hypothetical protein LTR85_005229 [Meristemomyces frigidus]|nr:hypothetical protein LTR85_005229 [Meristemomyces frigidus]